MCENVANQRHHLPPLENGPDMQPLFEFVEEPFRTSPRSNRVMRNPVGLHEGASTLSVEGEPAVDPRRRTAFRHPAVEWKQIEEIPFSEIECSVHGFEASPPLHPPEKVHHRLLPAGFLPPESPLVIKTAAGTRIERQRQIRNLLHRRARTAERGVVSVPAVYIGMQHKLTFRKHLFSCCFVDIVL